MHDYNILLSSRAATPKGTSVTSAPGLSGCKAQLKVLISKPVPVDLSSLRNHCPLALRLFYMPGFLACCSNFSLSTVVRQIQPVCYFTDWKSLEPLREQPRAPARRPSPSVPAYSAEPSDGGRPALGRAQGYLPSSNSKASAETPASRTLGVFSARTFGFVLERPREAGEGEQCGGQPREAR